MESFEAASNADEVSRFADSIYLNGRSVGSEDHATWLKLTNQVVSGLFIRIYDCERKNVRA